jgi:hypothetical protein
MATVDHDGQLHRPGPPVVVEGVERGPHRPPGEQHVVDQHHHGVGEVDGDLRHRMGQHPPEADVVAVEGDVEAAERGAAALDFGQRVGQGLGQRDAAAGQADEDHAVEAAVALGDLVGHAPRGPGDVAGVHHLGPGNENAP